MNRLLKSWSTEVHFEWYQAYRQIVIPVKIDYQKILIIPTQNGTIFRELLANTGGTIVKTEFSRCHTNECAIQINRRLRNESPTTGSNYPLL